MVARSSSSHSSSSSNAGEGGAGSSSCTVLFPLIYSWAPWMRTLNIDGTGWRWDADANAVTQVFFILFKPTTTCTHSCSFTVLLMLLLLLLLLL